MKRMRASALLLVLATAGCSGGNATPSSWTSGDTLHVRVDRVIPPSEIRQLEVVQRITGRSGDSLLFTYPVQLRLAKDGTFLLLDAPVTQLILFSPEGEFVRRIGKMGDGPGEYQDIAGFAPLPLDEWAIIDIGNRRVTVFARDATVKASWAFPTRRFYGRDMIVSDTAGWLRITQAVPDSAAGDRQVYVASSADVPFGDTLWAPTLGVKQEMYTVEFPGGGMAGRVNRFSPAEYVTWHPHGFPLLLETGEYRLVFPLGGGKVRVVHRRSEPVPLSHEEGSEFEKEILKAMRAHDPAWKWKGAPIPGHKPAASRVQVMRDGTIWVAANMPSERYTVRDSLAGGSPTERVAFRQHFEYEVFDAAGGFLGRVVLPPRTTLQDADGDRIWGFQFDETDVATIVRMQLSRPFDPAVHPPYQ